jgi:glycosyltransferase involved in cell wall biosynthesis
LEIVVVNDGIEDETKNICDKYSSMLDIKYYFSGQRNAQEIKTRCPAWAINIGVKKCSGYIIVLSCPEVWHLNDSLNYIVDPIINMKERIMTTPNTMYYDDKNHMVPILQKNINTVITPEMLNSLVVGGKGIPALRMPFLMGMCKNEFISIGGYDEDFIGYACDDNDFADRIAGNGVKLLRTPAEIIHLYHTGTNTGLSHADNPAWIYNNTLWRSRKGIFKRNQGRDWGMLE